MKSFFATCAFILLSGCSKLGTDQGSVSKPSDLDFGNPNKIQNLIQEREASRAPGVDNLSKMPAPKFDIQSYALSGEFSWETNTLTAEVKIRWKSLDPTQTTLILGSNVEVQSVVDAKGSPLPFQISKKERTLSIDVSSQLMEFPTHLQETSIKYTREANLFTSESVDSNMDGLIAVYPRKNSKVDSRVLYTTSEPNGASEWMPSILDPRDRALFEVSMKMDAAQSLETNGKEIENQILPNGKRFMHFRSDFSMPVYLMAIAIGEFKSVTSNEMGYPIRVVARKNFSENLNGILKTHLAIFKKFESLIGHYPFDSYTALLLPEFLGGMEHAGISFMCEEWVSPSLWAHELAHQWFGDMVTVSSWNDLWIKEGMATLLAVEAFRSAEDRTESGAKFSRYFSVTDGDAVIDPELAPNQKYTTGPYDRAAFVHNQIRHAAGEDKYWAIQREILSTHGFDSISSEEYIEAFKYAVSSKFFKSLQTALFSKKVPTYSLNQEGTKWKISVTDPDQFFMIPGDVRLHAMDGTISTEKLSPAQAVSVDTAKINFISYDEAGVQFPLMSTLNESVTPEVSQRFRDQALMPKQDLSKELLLLSGVSQNEFLTVAKTSWLPEKSKEAITVFNELKSDRAKRQFVINLCDGFSGPAKSKFNSDWRETLSSFFAEVNHDDQYYMGKMSSCRGLLSKDLEEKADERLLDTDSLPTLSSKEFLARFELGYGKIEFFMKLLDEKVFYSMNTVTQSGIIDGVEGYLADDSVSALQKKAMIAQLVKIGVEMEHWGPLAGVLYYLKNNMDEAYPVFLAPLTNSSLHPAVRKSAFCKIRKAWKIKEADRWSQQVSTLNVEGGKADATLKALFANEANICPK